MKIVIQCASKKLPDAGRMKNKDGKAVSLVAKLTPTSTGICVLPDAPVDSTGVTWRQQLLDYNANYCETGENPLGLVPAASLYTPPAYAQLRRHFEPKDIFILSAGWGLVRGDFLLPDYDITFSKNPNVAKESRRSARDKDWHDFNQLTQADIGGESLHFFGSVEYLKLFYQLLNRLDVGPSEQVVIHHKVNTAPRSGYRYEQYMGDVSTNWQYKALGDHLKTLSA